MLFPGVPPPLYNLIIIPTSGDEKTEAQRGKQRCQSSHSLQVGELLCRPGSHAAVLQGQDPSTSQLEGA